MAEVRWKDDDGMEAVFLDGRLSVYGSPSMTADNGDVAVGIDTPWLTELLGEPLRLSREELEELDRMFSLDSGLRATRVSIKHKIRAALEEPTVPDV